MANDAVRADRLSKLVRDERRTIASLLNVLDARVKAAETHAAKLRDSRKSFKERLMRFDARLERLEDWQDDPVVLVRTSPGGYGVPVYHDAEKPCGYMWRRANFRSMLLGEAEEAGHPPCSACGWRAKRRLETA